MLVTNVGIPGIPADPDTTYDFTLKIDMNTPPAAAPMRAAKNGFFNRMFTPYIAGSVIPINAVILVDIANDLKVLFFDLKKTPNAAPAWYIRYKHHWENVVKTV